MCVKWVYLPSYYGQKHAKTTLPILNRLFKNKTPSSSKTFEIWASFSRTKNVLFLCLRLIENENHSQFVPCKSRANYSLHNCWLIPLAKVVPIVLYITEYRASIGLVSRLFRKNESALQLSPEPLLFNFSLYGDKNVSRLLRTEYVRFQKSYQSSLTTPKEWVILLYMKREVLVSCSFTVPITNLLFYHHRTNHSNNLFNRRHPWKTKHSHHTKKLLFTSILYLRTMMPSWFTTMKIAVMKWSTKTCLTTIRMSSAYIWNSLTVTASL